MLSGEATEGALWSKALRLFVVMKDGNAIIIVEIQSRQIATVWRATLYVAKPALYEATSYRPCASAIQFDAASASSKKAAFSGFSDHF